MTTPNLPFGSTTQADLAQGVVMPSGLGSAWQDQSKAKYLSLASGRFPAPVRGTSAGSPAVSAGPLGFVVDLVAQFMSTVGHADPASIKRPEDLYDLVEDFVSDLPLVGELIDLKDAMLGEYTGDDPIFLFIQDLFAPLRKLLQLASGQSGIPTVGELTSGWSSLWDDIQADFGELLAALRGEYAGGDPILAGIQAWAGGLGGLVDAIASFAKVDLSRLTSSPRALLAAGSFDAPETIVAGSGWAWDEAVFRTVASGIPAGSARFDCDGTRGLRLSDPEAEIDPGEPTTVEAWASWRDVVSAGGRVRLLVRWYDSARTVIGETEVASVVISGTADWTKLAGSATGPAGCVAGRVLLRVDEECSAGSVWVDDVAWTSTQQSLPQEWVAGLTAALSALGADVAAALGWIKSLIEKLTGRARSEITDAIGDAQEFAAQLKTILGGGSVSSPLPNLAGSVVGSVQTMITQIASIAAGDVVTPINGVVQGFKDGWSGLSALTSGVESWIQDLIDAILRAIRKVPVVGGSLADIIAEVGGLNDRTDSAQQQAEAVQAGIVEGWTGGSTSGVDLDVYDTMGAIRALVGGDGYTRVNVTSTTTWTKPAGTTEVIVVGIAAGQNGVGGSNGTYRGFGGSGGAGGGHKVQALDASAFESLHITVGTSGAPTQFRLGGGGGPVAMEAIVGAPGGMATQFGYTSSNSGAGGGGNGGNGQALSDGNTAPRTDGSSGASSAAAPGGSGGNSSNMNGAAGGAGGASGGLIPCGGGGGGGGQGGRSENWVAVFKGYSGGAGGNGGFPGGGGGGGGGRGQDNLNQASNGAGGAGAAGLGIIFYR